MDIADYLDLTDPDVDLESVRIERGAYDCNLLDGTRRRYQGFVLARSTEGNALTLCDLSFQMSTREGKFPPRLVFRRTNRDLMDKAVSSGQFFQRISFQDGQDGYREFWRMVAFLYRFKEVVDLGEFFDTYRAVADDSVVLHLKAKDSESRKQLVAQYAERAEVDADELSQLLLLRTRRAALEDFRKLLLNERNYHQAYRQRHAAGIKGSGDEAIWHHFLSRNKWIFGLSLDLRFMEDFVDEASVGISDTANRGNPKADMLGWTDYTVLVELKTPQADIFTATKTKDARTDTWSFTPEFIEGFSQCLAQRSAWDKNHGGKTIVVEDERGERHGLDQGVIRTVDPQAIFIYGNKDREIPKTSTRLDVRTKRDTLERFIRNNRNINMISFDELYRRAYHIVNGALPPEGSTAEVQVRREPSRAFSTQPVDDDPF